MKERTKERTNVYQMVTDRIIAELEKGRIPWENLGHLEIQTEPLTE